MTVSAGQPGLPVLTAVTGRWESLLVSGLERERSRVEVVRRCADLADLLATAATGQARAVVLSADLRQLDGESLRLLRSDGCAVVALVEPGDEPAERRLRQLGVDQVLPADATAAAVAGALEAAVDDLAGLPRRRTTTRWMAASRPTRHVTGSVRTGPVAVAGRPGAVVERRPAGSSDVSAVRATHGGVIVVWGPAGAPGRTTTAVSLAAELAEAGASTLLVDADTYAASVGQVLGLLDEAPGLAAAARAADHGTLDVHQLSRLAPQVIPQLRVLTGIARSHRWPELRPAAVGTVLRLARSLSQFAVVDTGFCLEQDEELSYDTAAPRRNGATLAAIEHADTLIAVGAGDPVGLQRLVRGLQDLGELTSRRPLVVVTRVRAAAVGSNPERRVREALERYAGVADPVLVPDDPAALDAALLAGRTLAEVAPASAARQAYAALAQRLIAPAAAVPVRRRSSRPRRAAS
jgi:MinD-like ATPase involved in chromosome partitioning or flagellar assembly